MQPLEYQDNQDPLGVIVDFLEKVNEDQLAEKLLDTFARYSGNIEQYNLLAKLYLDIRSNERAEHMALKVLNMCTTPQEQYAARANLAKMYNNINYPEKSLVYVEQNEQQTPRDPEVLLEKVFALYLLNRKDEAEQVLRELKTRETEFSDRIRTIINFNLATYDMEQGYFQRGLRGFLENVKKLGIWFSPRELPYKQWQGGAYPGKTLIMFMEGGGIGDDFITIRFYKHLENLGFQPIFYTGKTDVANIFNRCGYRSVTSLENVPADSLWCYAMHVPCILELGPEQVKHSGYLWPSEQSSQKWGWIGQQSGLKIGVRWTGQSKNERNLHRQLSLPDTMRMLHDVVGDREATFYSLQVGDGQEEADQFPELVQLSSQITSFDDTFAILKNLDFVVTSCTSVLHASTIMGTPTYGMIPISSYFPWLSPAPPNHSIWYPDNLKLFRQVTPRQWGEPLAECAQHLREDFHL